MDTFQIFGLQMLSPSRGILRIILLMAKEKKNTQNSQAPYGSQTVKKYDKGELKYDCPNCTEFTEKLGCVRDTWVHDRDKELLKEPNDKISIQSSLSSP